MHGLWHGAAAVTVGAVVGVVVAVWGSSSPNVTQARRVAPRATATTVAVASSMPYELSTRCGIDDARVGNRYFVAVHPLSGRSGRPPTGWGSPYQAGTMTLVSPREAVFTDRTGHRVVFRVRRGGRTITCPSARNARGQVRGR